MFKIFITVVLLVVCGLLAMQAMDGKGLGGELAKLASPHLPEGTKEVLKKGKGRTYSPGCLNDPNITQGYILIAYVEQSAETHEYFSWEATKVITKENASARHPDGVYLSFLKENNKLILFLEGVSREKISKSEKVVKKNDPKDDQLTYDEVRTDKQWN